MIPKLIRAAGLVALAMLGVTLMAVTYQPFGVAQMRKAAQQPNPQDGGREWSLMSGDREVLRVTVNAGLPGCDSLWAARELEAIAQSWESRQ